MTDDRSLLASAYGGLKVAYREAYDEAKPLKSGNRELVHHVIAASSRAAVDQLALAGAGQQLVDEAQVFAAAAAREDQLTEVATLVNQLIKLVFPAGVGALLIAAGVIFANGLAGLFQGGRDLGALLPLVLGSGVAGGVIVRGLMLATQGAASAGNTMLKAIHNAYASVDPAKGVLDRLKNAERVFFGSNPPIGTHKARLVVSATGPLMALLLTAVFAIPVSIFAGTVAGAVTHTKSSPYKGLTPPTYTTPTYTLPFQLTTPGSPRTTPFAP